MGRRAGRKILLVVTDEEGSEGRRSREGEDQWRRYMGAAVPLVGFCYDQSKIYQYVIFRIRPVLIDNK